jgi:hypothetical protein
MVPLRVIVLHELGDRRAKMPLAERNQLGQALGPDGQYKFLCEGIQVRALCRQLDGVDPGVAKDATEPVGKEGVAVVDDLRAQRFHPARAGPRPCPSWPAVAIDHR